MGDDLKKMYRTVMDDHFPSEMTISFGDQTLVYRKRTWKIAEEKRGELVEKGLRYGENPGQEAALYELVNGNLVLGQCRFIEPGRGLVSAISEEDMIQSGKHPGKTNLTDVDNALNIMKYLTAGPAVVIVKHNNPCGVAYASTLAEAYRKADRADRIAAFGGCALFNRPIDLTTAEMISKNYLEVVAAPDFESGTVGILSQRANLRIIRIARMDRLSQYAPMRFVDFKSLIDGKYRRCLGGHHQSGHEREYRFREFYRRGDCEGCQRHYRYRCQPGQRLQLAAGRDSLAEPAER
ncbi:MAG: hypothetical protein R6V46_16265 [Desulfatiglandaceae bacterium]